MKNARLNFILGVFALCAVYLVGAQAVICFVKGGEYTQSAVAQRTGSVVVKSYRGKFLDRNAVPLVESDIGTVPMGADAESFAYLPVRYGVDSLARHLIGYVDGDGIGAAGLEKCFEDVLRCKSEGKVNVIKSADGKVVDDMGMRLSEGEYLSDSVLLTIDSHIQRIAEETMRAKGITGAVVIMDTSSFDVLAMASQPDYDQNFIQGYLSSDGGELVNRCLSPYNAGSIFKTVTLCAASEYGRLRDSYDCKGYIDVYEHTFNCHAREGHGTLNPMEAFSKSCNCAFYTMGLDMGDDAILNMAALFGLGNKVLFGCGELAESTGNIPDFNKTVFVDAVNLAIGQGEILLTPLQAANMVCIIANGGLAKSVNVAKEIRTSDGSVKTSLAGGGQWRVISARTAELVQKAMEAAVIDGTGISLKDSTADIAGKTGTAETGWVRDGKSLVHGWFCGYFPKENPRYAMAVLVEDGGSGAQSAAPVFKEIAEQIIKIYPLG